MGRARDQQILKLKKENEVIQAKSMYLSARLTFIIDIMCINLIAVKLEASRQQLKADLKMERKLQADLVRKVQLMSVLNESLISQKYVSTVDTSVQANYLAVASG